MHDLEDFCFDHLKWGIGDNSSMAHIGVSNFSAWRILSTHGVLHEVEKSKYPW